MNPDYIKGVNLGNWLVLEKWMSPALFDGTTADDEYYLPVYGQINVYGVTTKSERHKRSYWTRTADGNGIGGRKAPVPYGS